MQKIILILFCTTTLFGCSKDKLKKEKEVLVGTWKWKNGTYTYDMCQQGPYSQMDIDPAVLNVNYTIQFLIEGRVRIYKNGSLLEKGKIKFDGWNNESSLINGYAFSIFMNNDEGKYISGSVNQDTLRLSNSYFFEQTASCKSEYTTCCRYKCYYTRQ